MNRQKAHFKNKVVPTAQGGAGGPDEAYRKEACPEALFLLLVGSISGVIVGCLFAVQIPLAAGIFVAMLLGCFIGWRAHGIGVQA